MRLCSDVLQFESKIKLHFNLKHFIEFYMSKKFLHFYHLGHTAHLRLSHSRSLVLSHSYSVIFRLISEVMHFLQIKEEASPPPTTFAQSPSLTPPPFPPGRWRDKGAPIISLLVLIWAAQGFQVPPITPRNIITISPGNTSPYTLLDMEIHSEVQQQTHYHTAWKCTLQLHIIKLQKFYQWPWFCCTRLYNTVHGTEKALFCMTSIKHGYNLTITNNY